jgi:hypothetical protein
MSREIESSVAETIFSKGVDNILRYIETQSYDNMNSRVRLD